MPAREIALLHNPAAGSGRGGSALPAVVRRFRDAGIAVRVLTGRDAVEAAELGRRAVLDGVEALVVCGGDGMVGLGARALAGSGLPLGIIPTGTGNDAARQFDLPRGDPLAAADRVIAGRTRTIDLARCGDRYIVTVLAAGFDALVNERANTLTWPPGRLRYTRALIQELRAFEPLRYTLDLDGEVREVEAMLVSVGNTESLGGGIRLTHGADPADGLLDVVLIKPVSKAELVRVYPSLFRGGHVRHPQYERIRVRRLTLAAPGVVAYADGERVGRLPLSVEVVPGALRVFA
ncbi:diacylglycerol/lipid kinase family protein [Nocardioides insulae]|uniref:diacylglycerol/lipid kinase family protein n=1 Tax=Nocardioides insulae TaxID=394734 RepID=UPI00048FFAF8|nr:YegS/Rv2252/BmrU family lipid kinase [Nocardioides insulae]